MVSEQMSEPIECSNPDCTEDVHPKRVELGFTVCIYCGEKEKPNRRIDAPYNDNLGTYSCTTDEGL